MDVSLKLIRSEERNLNTLTNVVKKSSKKREVNQKRRNTNKTSKI